ncbi:hypothetical protein NVP2275O_177 [Vibrio phage 2.275.O._10N.286.54.E11]|nr:hypothetical protein NVP2275O_177 [Vibrio phage 2.275.O._10N.286.54.E11]
MSDHEKLNLKDFEPDHDLETHLLGDGFDVHGVMFRHFDLIQSLLYMSSFCYDAIRGSNPVKSNSLLITVDNGNGCVLCSAGNYNPPPGSVDESNTAIVHEDKTSYFLTNGFLVDNFQLEKPQRDYVTDEGEILITRMDIEEITDLRF